MTIEQAISDLDNLGSWTGITELAESHHPELLEAARQASREVDRDPTPAAIRKYFMAWRDLFLAAHPVVTYV